MAILYFAFANDPDNPLDQLQKEYEQIKNIFEPLDQKGLIELKMEPFANLDVVAQHLSLYRKELILFHFAGHAEQEGIFLDGQLARSIGIAGLLEQCPNLMLVFINGCSSIGQLKLLEEAGIPSTILTHSAIGDNKALQFAVQFYRQLSFPEPLGQSFNSAKNKILSIDKTINISRGRRSIYLKPKCPWGLSYLEGREDMEDWKLPLLSHSSSSESTYIPNNLLIQSLWKSLSPYNKALKKLLDQQKTGIDPPKKKIRKEVLRTLPHPLSEHIRKLLSIESGTLKATFYNQPSLARLVQMLNVYRTIIKLFCFVLLAQLWDIYKNPTEEPLPFEEGELIKSFFRQDYHSSKLFNFFELFIDLHALFCKKNFPFFLKEFDNLTALLEEESTFYHSCSFMESLYKNVQDDKITEADAITRCERVESMLANILEPVGFFGHYTLTSIKNINLIKYRHLEKPVFSHSVVKLVQEFVGLDEEQVIWSDYFDNTSVLMIEKNIEDEMPINFLNLSPFIIDLNAFDSKASLAKLHFLDRYIQEQYAFAYKHIYLPDENPLIVNSKKAYYNILQGQFDFYSNLLFKQKLNKAI